MTLWMHLQGQTWLSQQESERDEAFQADISILNDKRFIIRILTSLERWCAVYEQNLIPGHIVIKLMTCDLAR